MPPLFAVYDAILPEERVPIVENTRRSLECEAAMFQLVEPILFVVPFESHRLQNV
jgi:hypothetical protein